MDIDRLISHLKFGHISSLESSSTLLNDASNQISAREALEDHTTLLNLIEDLKEIESSQNTKLPERTDQSWKEFFQWVDSELGGCTKIRLSDKIDVAKHNSLLRTTPGHDQQEYSLVTKEPLKKGDNVISVPRKLMLSTETAIKDVDLCDFIKKDSIASTMQNVVLVLHLLNEYSKGKKSYWSPYLAILPNKVLPVLTLNKKTLEFLLASSHIFEVLKMIRAIARQYSYFFKRLQSTNLPLSRDFTYEYYCWGVSMVCSRQNEVPPANRRTFLMPVVHALIPILDMCNHDGRSNQAFFEDDCSKLVASRDLNDNDEITINYGSRSSGDFFTHNGFVPAEVPFDIVPLTIILNKQDPLFALRVKLLKTLNMPAFGRFRLTHNNYENRHKRDPHLTMFLIVYFLSEDEINFIMDTDNSVGVADEIYEYVQYNECAINNITGQPDNNHKKDESVTFDDEDKEKLSAIKTRIEKSVKEHLSKRASIGIALIDRAFKDRPDLIDDDMSMMLKHEKSIYESHLIKCHA